MPAAEPDATELPADPFAGIDLDAQARVAVAVSGGGDSMALLDLLAERLAPERIVALTVDHGLRAGSEAEAVAVARFCAARGIAHRTLRWEGEKPRSGLAAAAREARYRLMARAARAAGIGLVLVGHTRDDQAETVAMRAARGPGRGLAGIAPATLVEGSVWFARPLLGTSRAALRNRLRERRIGWSDDPTNEDPAFERARLRAAPWPAGELRRLLDLAAREARARADCSCRAAALVGEHASLAAPGLLRVDRAMFAAEGEPALLAMRAALAIAGGRTHLAEAGAAADSCTRLHRGECFRRALSGALVDARRGAAFILREGRGKPVPAAADGEAVFDGRWRAMASGNCTACIVAAGEGAAVDPAVYPSVPTSLVREAARREPLVEPAGAGRLERVLAPWMRFLPLFDLELAQAFAHVLDAPDFPAPPLRRHIEAEA